MLSPNKLKYIKGIQKYVSFSVVTTIAIAIVVLTIFIVNQTVVKGKVLSDIPSSPFFSVIIIALLLYCFVFYRIKKRFKRLQELIEQMTEEEFQFLLQAQSSLSFYLPSLKSKKSTLKKYKKCAGTIREEVVIW